MTQEEKAKLYDELKVKAQELAEDGYIDKLALVDMFPELKESRDEMIRQLLISFVKYDMPDNYSDDFSREDCLAWLEKQGEQKTVNEIAKEVCKNKESATAFLKSAGIMNEKGELAEQYRQDEQKSADTEKGTNGSEREFPIPEPPLTIKHAKEVMGIKQDDVWSEEDAKALNRISTILVDASEVKNWWKEYRLIERDEMIRLTDFLKSLKDRYTWKPSDEQMKALEHFVRSVGESGYASPYDNNTKLLYSLLSDLKKLKE